MRCYPITESLSQPASSAVDTERKPLSPIEVTSVEALLELSGASESDQEESEPMTRQKEAKASEAKSEEELLQPTPALLPTEHSREDAVTSSPKGVSLSALQVKPSEPDVQMEVDETVDDSDEKEAGSGKENSPEKSSTPSKGVNTAAKHYSAMMEQNIFPHSVDHTTGYSVMMEDNIFPHNMADRTGYNSRIAPEGGSLFRSEVSGDFFFIIFIEL